MPIKGLVYVPPGGPRGAEGEAPGTQEVATRPLVCLVLEQLAAEGARTCAVLCAEDHLPGLRGCVSADVVGELATAFITPPAPGRGLAGALLAAREFVGDDAAILHLATGLLSQSCESLVTAADEHPAQLRLLLQHTAEDGAPLSPDTQRLLGMGELGGGHLAPAGVAVAGPGWLARCGRGSALAAFADAAELGDLGDPADPAVAPGGSGGELVALAEAVAHEGVPVSSGIVSGWCEYAPEPRALLELNRSVLDRQATWAVRPSTASGNRIEGRVVIHPTADVRTSVILGPALIGAGARIADAYVGPYTTIGAGAVIENCEVVRSIVGPGARIAHVGGRIEESTIGSKANIFRDFRLPRAMRLHVGEGVELALD